MYSKTCFKPPLKNRQNKGFNGIWKLNEGRKYCRMLPTEQEWPLKTGFTVVASLSVLLENTAIQTVVTCRLELHVYMYNLNQSLLTGS